jgi:LPS-assembly lipoprotein
MPSFGLPRGANIFFAVALAGLVGGCFRPLYGDFSASGTGVVDKMRSIEVVPIKTGSGRVPRIGGEVRTELMYQLTGGGATNSTEYRLIISLGASSSSLVTDVSTGRSDSQILGIDASYSLIETSTGKPVLSGTTFARTSYDFPGQQQRFAGERALRNAENQAAKVIAENIRTRIESHFAVGPK